MRKQYLTESVGIKPDSSTETKQLYKKLIGSQGIKDITTEADIEDGFNFAILIEPPVGNREVGDVYLNVRDNENGTYTVFASGSSLKLYKNFVDGLTAKDILALSDALWDDGVVSALSQFGFKGDVIYTNSIGRRVEYTVESLQEALGDEKFNKIRKLITECKKEGFEVSISIPKKTLNE